MVLLTSASFAFARIPRKLEGNWVSEGEGRLACEAGAGAWRPGRARQLRAFIRDIQSEILICLKLPLALYVNYAMLTRTPAQGLVRVTDILVMAGLAATALALPPRLRL